MSMWTILIGGGLLSLIAGAVVYWYARIERQFPARLPFREFSVPDGEKVAFRVFERRTHERSFDPEMVECRDLARVVYSGIPFEAKVVDSSQGGCRILSNNEIPLTSLLYLKHEGRQRPQLAFVVYCRNLGIGFQTGLEFLPQSQ